MLSDFKRISFKYKNNKFWYYLRNYLRLLLPDVLFRKMLERKVAQLNPLNKEYIEGRVNYYNRLDSHVLLCADSPHLKDLKLGKKLKTYFFDSKEYTRYFNPSFKACFLFGDVTHVPNEPTIVKSRPTQGDSTNSVLLKLGKVRHFIFINDPKPFESKKNMLVGRTKAHQPHRVKFLEMYFNHPLCNIGQVNRNANLQFLVNRMTISEHLDYKFILCLEGNDVASNLKWVMSSNSLAVMPTPKYETWFMEGTLIPNFHFVQIKDDYSDLEERINYYSTHPEDALQILQNAHRYVEQFKNKKQEDLISLLVLKKYFEKTNNALFNF